MSKPVVHEVYRCSLADQDEACGIDGQQFDCAYDECHHPLKREFAQHIVDCLNANEIQLHRGPQGWAVMQDNFGKWCLIPFMMLHSQQEIVEWMSWLKEAGFPDPSTCWIESDRWFRANIEKEQS